MAVYEQKYKLYSGPLTPEGSRLLIIPRYALRDVFGSKLFTGFFALCYICPLVMSILIYLHYNVNALAIMQLRVRDLLAIDADFFRVFVTVQSSFAFLLTVIVGPPLVSRDMANNALPLYLCRPFSRKEYVIGKMSVLTILLSAVTWVPGLLLFAFQSYLEGISWFAQNLWISAAIFLTSWTWILVLALLSLTMSAWVKWRIAASAGIFAVYIIPNVFALMVVQIFSTRWGNIISLSKVLETITAALFRSKDLWAVEVDARLRLPAAAAWFALIAFYGICLLLLTRRVKAYEVVR